MEVLAIVIRQEKEILKIGRERVKLLFTDPCKPGKPNEMNQNTVTDKKNLNKVTRYKISIKKSVALINTNNYQLKNKMKELNTIRNNK